MHEVLFKFQDICHYYNFRCNLTLFHMSSLHKNNTVTFVDIFDFSSGSLNMAITVTVILLLQPIRGVHNCALYKYEFYLLKAGIPWLSSTQ